jgi:hypothetical protein
VNLGGLKTHLAKVLTVYYFFEKEGFSKMAKKSIILLAVLLIVTKANATLVEYNLNCGGSYTLSTNWTENFNLGVAFSQVSHIYLQWSGSIKAAHFELIVPIPISEPYCDGFFSAKLYEFNSSTLLANKIVYGGKDTAPNPESFSLQSEFNINDFSPFLDGVGTIKINLGQTYPIEWYSDIPLVKKVSDASGQLSPAKLIFNGTVVPEPSIFVLLSLGTLFLKRKK